MEYKKTIMLLALVVFLLGIAGVSASEIDDTLASEDTNTIGLSVDNDIIEDNLQTSEENDELALTDNDETLSAKNDTDVLSDNSGTYSGLSDEIGSGGNIELKHDYYTYDTGNTISISVADSVIDGKGAIINMTGSNICAFTVSASGVTIKNLTIINANCDGHGGAIYFSSSATSGTVSNCNFADNHASGDGGAIMGSGTVSNCNFTGNTARYGGAVYFTRTGSVSNCNFTNNKATGTYSWGGAIRMSSGTVSNCNFADNHASGEGGAVYFDINGEVTNCNFTNNSARYGGAVEFDETGTVTNCNFTNNTATSQGGAIRFISTGTVTNCNFTNNSARYGGAVEFDETGTVTNCNFTNNTATSQGGAIRFISTGTVTNCNFTGNNATAGSAIYFDSTSANKTVSNSRFLNNRANAEALEITKNDNNITITFTGRNNLLNAIYSSNDAEVTFTNVTYWGANGITTVSATMSGSNKATGQNITVGVVVNGKVVLNEVKVTDENGMIVLPIIAGENYYISARHDTDSYYPEAEKAISNNTKFNVNVTSQTTTNKTVNITAKSNIPQDVVQGKLLFILPNGTQIEATYGANGTWWAEHTFDAYGEYKVNATYVGLDNVAINNGTITINKVNSTITLDDIVLDYGETKNVTVTTTGATGITAKIGESDVKVDGFVISIPVLDAGNYTLTVTTIPDDDYNSVTKEVNITVNKVNSTLTVGDMVFDYGSSGSTVVSITGADGVNATVVEQPKSVVKVNGTNITVSGLDAGTYTLTVTTIADKNHNNVTENATITVNKVNATLTVDDVVLDYGETKNVTVTAEGVTGIVARIGESEAKVDGFVISIPALDAGTYTLTVTAIADNNHNNVTKNATIIVNKLKTELTGSAIITTYNINKDLVITLKDSTGKALANVKLTVDLNGAKTYTTDKNGQVKVSTKGLAPKTYTAKVTFKGNTNYAKSTKNVKVTVKKATPKLTAKKKTFKTTTKTKKYTITLKDNTGKAIKKAKVTLKVKGKTYKATTNSKGKAVFKIKKLNKKGTFKATVTYKGNKYYNKVSKKAKIKVIVTFKTVS